MSADDSLVTDWFKQFCAEARGHANFRWFDGGSTGRMMIEVLSDAANELFCSAVLAGHFRRFGMVRYPNERFWVRSEWAKFDLCYGIATDTFRNWDTAWADGTTGDLGTVEVKVLFWHYARTKILSKVAELETQLQARRLQIGIWRRHLNRKLREAPHVYSGILLLSGRQILLPTPRMRRASMSNLPVWWIG